MARYVIGCPVGGGYQTPRERIAHFLEKARLKVPQALPVAEKKVALCSMRVRVKRRCKAQKNL
jgi:hypothetical protein